MTAVVYWRCRKCGSIGWMDRKVWPDRLRLHFYDCSWRERPKKNPGPLREYRKW